VSALLYALGNENLLLDFFCLKLYILFVQNLEVTIMEKINVSTLRENLSAFISKAQKGQVITITSHGHELAMLVPAEDKRNTSKKKLKELGKNAIIGDIVSPVDGNWEVMT